MSDFSLDDLVPNEDVPPLDSLDTPVSAINFDDLFVSSLATKRRACEAEEDDDEQLSHKSKRRCVRDTFTEAAVTNPTSCWPTYLTLGQLDQSITQFFEELEESDIQVDVSNKQWNVIHMSGSAYVKLNIQIFERFAAHEVQHCVHVRHVAGNPVLFQQVNGLLGSSLLHPSLDFNHSGFSTTSSTASASPSSSSSPLSLFSNPVMREMIRFRAGLLMQPVSQHQQSPTLRGADSDVQRTEAAGFLCGVVEDCRNVREMASLYDTYLVPHALLRCFDSPVLGWTQTFALRALLRLSELDGRYIDLITVHAAFPALIRFMTAVEHEQHYGSSANAENNDFARMARHFSTQLRETLMASAASHLLHSLVSSVGSYDSSAHGAGVKADADAVSPATTSASRELLMTRYGRSEATSSPLHHVSCRG